MEGSSSCSGANASSAESHGEANSSANSSKTKLNPNASKWSLAENRSPESMRTLFVTFTKQQPLDDHEIAWFFNYNYGRCVQRVIVFPAADQNNPPVSGIVVFRYASVPALIMAKEMEAARFWVNGKPMWCKWYELRRRT